MKVLVIMHTGSEGSGTIGEFLEFINANVHTARLYAGEGLPKDGERFDAIVSMGGPMNVYEEDRYPFLAEETVYLKRAIDAYTPILGICLGSQMIAKACGALVKKAPVREVGWYDVRLTDAGMKDELFQDVAETLRVLQWHEDTFEIPCGGTLLATSRECPNQAFRYRNAYGLQFHIEVTREILVEWFRKSTQQHAVLAELEEIEDSLVGYARKIYTNFVTMVGT